MKKFVKMLVVCGLAMSLSACGSTSKASQVKPERQDTEKAHETLSEAVQAAFNELETGAEATEYIYFDEDEYPELVVYTKDSTGAMQASIYYGKDATYVQTINPQSGDIGQLFISIGSLEEQSFWYAPYKAKLIEKEVHENEGATMVLVSGYNDEQHLELTDVVMEYTKELDEEASTETNLVYVDLEAPEYYRLLITADAMDDEQITKEEYDEIVDTKGLEQLTAKR